MSVPKVTSPSEKAQAAPRTGVAMAVIMSLHGRLAVAFTSGLHAAFYASMGFMALAAALSALRAGSYPETRF